MLHNVHWLIYFCYKSQWSNIAIEIKLFNTYILIIFMEWNELGRFKLSSNTAVKLFFTPKLAGVCADWWQRLAMHLWCKNYRVPRKNVSYNCFILRPLTVTVITMLSERNWQTESEVWEIDCGVDSSQKALQLWGKCFVTFLWRHWHLLCLSLLLQLWHTLEFLCSEVALAYDFMDFW